MKKIITILGMTAVVFSSTINGQTHATGEAISEAEVGGIKKSTFFQKINAGLMLGSFTERRLEKSHDREHLEIEFNLLANTNLLTKRTFHNLQYGFGNNSIGLNQGVLLPKEFEVFILNMKSLNSSKTYYSAIGVEKLVELGEGGSCCIFLCELGTDYSGHTTATVGIMLCFQTSIWKHK